MEKRKPLVVDKMTSYKQEKRVDFVIKLAKSKRHATSKFKLIPCYKPISLMPD